MEDERKAKKEKTKINRQHNVERLFIQLLRDEQDVQVSDTTKYNSSTKAGSKKLFISIK